MVVMTARIEKFFAEAGARQLPHDPFEVSERRHDAGYLKGVPTGVASPGSNLPA